MPGTQTQTSLLCGCGAGEFGRAGLCTRCERRQRLNAERFAGLREFVLQRDDHQCQICGEMDEALILVHHRRKNVRHARHLITLCLRCHPVIHFTLRPGLRFASIALLRTLWREVHPGAPEQRVFSFLADDEGIVVWSQAELFPG